MIKQKLDRISLFFRHNKEITVLLFMAFMCYFFLVDRNSYWLDELYSVVTYGIDHDSVSGALRHLGEGSIHPPLYQGILYYWMDWFGHSEVSTRLLSIIYVILATFFLYLFTLRLVEKRFAILSSMLFVTSYMVIYYAIETRSYAQSLMLTTLSSYTLLNYLLYIKDETAFKSIYRNWPFAYFVLANTALIMTHYYNIFFLASQGTFLLFWFIWYNPQKNILPHLIKALVPYLISIGIFLVIWGRYFFNRVAIRHDSYTVDEVSLNPIAMLNEMILIDNFSFPAMIYLIITVFFVYIIWEKLTAKSPKDYSQANDYRNPFYLYLIIWGFLPFVFTYVSFSLIQFERYMPRYFIYVIPALIIVLAVVIEQFLQKVDQLAKNILPSLSIWRFYTANNLLIAFVAVMIFTFYNGYQGATQPKQDWRGVAEQIVLLIENDPNNRYIIYETTFRSYPTIDYYLKRASDNQITASGVIQRTEENRLA